MIKSNRYKNSKRFLVILISMFLLSTSLIHAERDEYQNYMHSSTVPKGDINPEGTYQTDLFTGAFVYSYPIQVPQGTNGLQPQISLAYNNQNTNSKPNIVGSAWTLSQSYIQRDVHYSPSNISDDKFILFINGNKYDLVYSNGRYHTEIESYLYIQKNSQDWTVKAKDGTTYRFGYNLDSRLDSNQYSYVWRWSLDKITDTHGNNIYLTYLEDPYSNDIGTVYPNIIIYNNDQKRKIEFVYENTDRSDIRTIYEQGHKIIFSRRLKEIKVTYDNNLVRKYVLDYGITDYARSFLTQVTQYGNDGVSSLPPTKFDYYQNKGWTEDISWQAPISFNYRRLYDGLYYSIDGGVRFIDINRDGLVDVLRSYDASNENHENVWYNNGNGWTEQSCSQKCLPIPITEDIGSWLGRDTQVRFGNLNDDGFIDIAQFCVPDENYVNVPYLKTDNDPWGRWWTRNETWCIDPSLSEGMRLVDINGDGRSDVVSAQKNTGRYILDEVHINTGTGWSWDRDLEVPACFDEYWREDSEGNVVETGGTLKSGQCGTELTDLNGDGLVDIIQGNYDTYEKGAWLNTGEGWIEYNSSKPPVYLIDINRRDNGVRIADVNGDGLSDIIQSDQDKSQKNVWINTGEGWAQDNSWNIPGYFIESDGDNKYVRLADVNGDGFVDVIESRKTSGDSVKHTWLNNAAKNFMLKEINNSLGGSTIIDYEKSTSNPSSNLGFNIWVVKSITLNNNMIGPHNTSSTTQYKFTGGMFDYEDREFRGFNYAEETKPDGTKLKHYFYQDDGRKGKEYKTEIFDINNNPFQKTEYGWEAQSNGNYYITLLRNVTDYTYDGWNG